MNTSLVKVFRSALAIVLGTLALTAGAAHAQAYPHKPIRVIVGSAPGGVPDILARAIAQKLTDSLGQQVVIDNRAGASGVIGAEMTAHSAADGYTLFLSTTMRFAILPNLKKPLPYDVVKDFSSVTQLAFASNVLVINSAVAAKSVAELIRLEKSKPGALNCGSAGSGSPAHLGGEMLNMMAGIRMTHVPYKGAAPALLDVIAGQVQLIITSPISAVLRTPEIQQRFKDLVVEVAPTSREAFAQFMRADTARWARVIKEAGIPLQ